MGALSGLYDYKVLADTFMAFASEMQECNGKWSNENKERLFGFAKEFVDNQCYRLPEIRKQAMQAGQQIIGIPVTLEVREQIEMTVGEDNVARTVIENRTVASQTNQQSVERQSGDFGSDEVGTPSSVRFSADGTLQ